MYRQGNRGKGVFKERRKAKVLKNQEKRYIYIYKKDREKGSSKKEERKKDYLRKEEREKNDSKVGESIEEKKCITA